MSFLVEFNSSSLTAVAHSILYVKLALRSPVSKAGLVAVVARAVPTIVGPWISH